MALDLKPGYKNQMHLQFPSRAENVAFARAVVASFAAQLDFTLDEIEEIRVAVSEAVTNSVIHAYQGEIGIITLDAALRDDRLELVVTDHGRGIADVAWALLPGNTTEPEERMGLGLAFVTQYMEGVRVESAPGQGTRVFMAKSPGAAGLRH